MGAPILMYHKVGRPGPEARVRGHYVPPRLFARQIALLARLGYRPIRPAEAREATGKAVAITFDDGYRNVLTEAAPTLARHGWTATVYAVVDRLGASDVWDGGVEPLLSEDELRALHAQGWEIGSHTLTHADLTAVDEATAQREIARSRARLQEMGLGDVAGFCYPYGRHDDAVARRVAEAGYAYACSTLKGGNGPQTDRYRLRRVNVRADTFTPVFLLKLLRAARHAS